MKITEVTTYSVHTTQFRNFNFVRIDTDEGVHGVGELFCIGADKATAEMVKYVSEWVVGMDPLDRERIQKRILNYSRFPGGSILYTAASAIDLALWDIAGKIANLPVYKMVGAVRDRVPVYCHTMGKDSKAALEMLQPKIEKYGYKACKVGVKGLGYFPTVPPKHASWRCLRGCGTPLVPILRSASTCRARSMSRGRAAEWRT